MIQRVLWAFKVMWAYRSLRLGLPVVFGGLVLVFALLPRLVPSSTADLKMHRVARKDFVHEVIQRGTLESASNVDIRCEVEAQDWFQGTQILEVVPEGTYVQAGDVVVRLDSSAREQELNSQQLQYNAAEADLIGSQNDLINAQASLREYLEGTFLQSQQDLKARIFSAEEDLRKAKEVYDASQSMYGDGFVNQLQLQADQFAVDRAEVNLDLAKSRLHVLENFTRPKRELEMTNQIKSTEIRVESRKYILELRKKRLEEVQGDIKKCTIQAPAAGQVVYANDPNYWLGPVVIEEGAWVRQRQVILRLPDPKRMIIKTNVNESRVALLRSKMPAEIRLDARRETVLRGTVLKVNDYPLAPSHWSSASIKEYGATIAIEGEPAGLRPGLTAEVKVCIQRLDDQLQVPVDAILEHDHRHFCIISEGGRLNAREVQIGPTDGQMVVIRQGLTLGQQVVAGATALRNRVALPAPAGLPRTVATAPAQGRGPS